MLLCALAVAAPASAAAGLSEYQLKAAFLYNFALFTEWPADVGATIRLCIEGRDPFGPELDALQGKPAAHRQIAIDRTPGPDALAACQIVFIPQSSAAHLAGTVERLRGTTVLTVAESPGAARQGVVLNMAVTGEKITFQANLRAARQARLTLSSKLLRLATEVIR